MVKANKNDVPQIPTSFICAGNLRIQALDYLNFQSFKMYSNVNHEDILSGLDMISLWTALDTEKYMIFEIIDDPKLYFVDPIYNEKG